MNILNCGLILTLISFLLLQTGFADPKEDILKSYNGPSVSGTDPSTLTGKVMTRIPGVVQL